MLTKWAAFLLAVSAQTLCADLARYSSLVVADGTGAKPDGVRVTYLGTNGYQLESNGNALLIDPYFSRIGLSRVALGSRIRPDLSRIDAGMKYLRARSDAILATHGHFDHLLDVPVVMGRTGARLLASSTAVELVKRAGAPAAKCDAVTAGTVRRMGPWKIRVLPATHDRLFGKVPFSDERKGSGSPERAGDWVCGKPLSFLIEIEGQRIFIDSGGTPGLLPPADIAPVDLAILGVALPDSRVRFAETVRRLRPRYILPSHQDDFFRPLSAGFGFGTLTDFPGVLREYEHGRLPGRLILLDYFRPWTLPRK